MLHFRYHLLFPPKLFLRGFLLRGLLDIQVLQEFPFSYPFRVYPIEPPDLPPLVAADDILEIIRAEPVD
jgi:hypothetical protein